jgi:hypothetical protein
MACADPFTDNLKILQNSLLEKPSINPQVFFSQIQELSLSAHTLCAITAASQLGLFEYLLIPRLQKEISAQYSYPDMIPPLLHILQNEGLLNYSEEGYVCSDTARLFLTASSPYNQITYLEKHIRHLKDLWLSLSEIFINGPKLFDEQTFFAELSLPSMAANALCSRLQDVTSAIVSLKRFSSARKMIDLGGGHGLYAMALAFANPNLKAIVFDLPQVVTLAESYIKKYGMQERVSTKGGNFFSDDIGDSYDIILSSSNPSGKSKEILTKIVAALNPGGYFVNVQPGETHSSEDPYNQLEWLLWSFFDVTAPKKEWGKRDGFLTEEYQKALTESGLLIISIEKVPDIYMKDYWVTMVIAEKI